MKTYPFLTEKYTESILSIDAVRKWLRVDIDGFNEEDDELQELIEEAVSHVEKQCNISLGVSEYTWYCPMFPTEINDLRKVKEVVSIEYRSDGDYVSLPVDQYRLVPVSDMYSKIIYADRYSLPVSCGSEDFVRVKLKAGFSELPARLRGAMRALVGERYDNRGDSVAEKKTLSDKLMAPYMEGYAG